MADTQQQQVTAAMVVVCVVGFHHTEGNRVECVHPPGALDGDGDGGGGAAVMAVLPFLALPDSVHLRDRDHVFFVLPPRPSSSSSLSLSSSCALFCTSAFQQAKAPRGATRSHVQKAVCVLAPTATLWGARVLAVVAPAVDQLLHQPALAADPRPLLRSVAEALSSQSLSLPPSLPAGPCGDSCVLVPVARVVFRVGPASVLGLLKLLVAEQRTVCVTYRAGVGDVCDLVLLVGALVPGAFCGGGDGDGGGDGSPACASLARARVFGFPLSVVSGGAGAGDVFFSPLVCLQQIPTTIAAAARTFFVGASNMLFLTSPPAGTDAVFDVVTGQFACRTRTAQAITELTAADRRFVERMAAVVLAGDGGGDNDEAEWAKRDVMVCDMFRDYLERFLACYVTATTTVTTTTTTAPASASSSHLADFGLAWVTEWTATRNHAEWIETRTPELTSLCPAEHPGGPSALQQLGGQIATSVRDLQQAVTPYAERVGSALSRAMHEVQKQAQAAAHTVATQAQQAIQQRQQQQQQREEPPQMTSMAAEQVSPSTTETTIEEKEKERQDEKPAEEEEASAETQSATESKQPASVSIAQTASQVQATLSGWFTKVASSQFITQVKSTGSRFASNISDFVLEQSKQHQPTPPPSSAPASPTDAKEPGTE
jgi:hypothetical protein